jgi:subtilisin family serine protease
MIFRVLVSFSLVAAAMTAEATAAVQFIVQLSNSRDASRIASQMNATILDSSDNTYLMSANSLPATLPKGVDYVEADKPITVQPTAGAIFAVPSSSPANWYMAQPAMQLIRLAYGQYYTTGTGTVIADIDSAVDYTHPALAGHLIGGADFVRAGATTAGLNQSSAAFLDQSSAAFLDQSSAAFLDQSSAAFLEQSAAAAVDAGSAAHGHGTMVAGILAAVAPGAKIMPIRAFDDQGNGTVWAIKKAIKYAVANGANVINMSFGLTSASKTLENAIAAALKNDVVVVSSAGNNGSAEVQYPSGYTKVIGVAATDLFDQKASFSNYGVSVYVTAPGVNVVSGYPGGRYAVLSGTSFASPMVAGQAALMRTVLVQYGVDFNQYPFVDCVRFLLAWGAVNVDDKNANWKNQLGHGRINLENSKQ